jgi:hypothetical protein
MPTQGNLGAAAKAAVGFRGLEREGRRQRGRSVGPPRRSRRQPGGSAGGGYEPRGQGGMPQRARTQEALSTPTRSSPPGVAPRLTHLPQTRTAPTAPRAHGEEFFRTPFGSTPSPESSQQESLHQQESEYQLQ